MRTAVWNKAITMDARNDFKATLQMRAVGRALAAWRRNRGLSLAEASRLAGWSTATISMLERAIYPIKDYHVDDLARAYDVGGIERGLVWRGLQRAYDSRAWQQQPGCGVLPCVGWTYSEVESEAGCLRIFAGDVLPRLVRTVPYAGAVNAAQAICLSDRYELYEADVQQRNLGRLRKNPVLRLHLIISETVLRHLVGGRGVMTDQLELLLELSCLPAVTLEVVPEHLGVSAGFSSHFTLMSFDEQRFDDVVFVEHLHGGIWLEDAFECEPYEATFLKLSGLAVSGEEARAYLAEALRRIPEYA